MDKKLKTRRITRRTTAAAIILGIAVGGFVPATAANASGWWSPRHVTCPNGKFAQVTFKVTVDRAIIGYGATSSEAGWGRYLQIEPGTTRVLNFGRSDGWWQKWNDPGNEQISVTTSCVSWG